MRLRRSLLEGVHVVVPEVPLHAGRRELLVLIQLVEVLQPEALAFGHAERGDVLPYQVEKFSA
jgi:hypothetical protein